MEVISHPRYFIANKYHLNYSNLGNLHVFSQKNISNPILRVLKLSKFGLHNLSKVKIKSKTWEDHLKMRNNNENII